MKLSDAIVAFADWFDRDCDMNEALFAVGAPSSALWRSLTAPVYVTCPRCGGTGRVEAGISERGRCMSDVCRSCGGCGEVAR